MTLVLSGTNTFEVRQALQVIETNFKGTPERIDGSTVTLSTIPDLLMGVSLFAEERLVIIDQLSANSAVWANLGEWLPRISDAIQLVLIEPTLDKRTSTYKALKAAVEIREFPAWTDRDTARAQQWVGEQAKKLGLALDSRLARHLVDRVGVDQWQLWHSLSDLSLLDEVSVDVINQVVIASPRENIFQLFEVALEGRPQQVAEMLKTLELQEDPYATFALLSSQAFTLGAVTFAEDSDNPVKDFAIHQFVASKLVRHGKRLGRLRVGEVLEAFAKTDADMKRSKAEPWLLIERLLIGLAS